MKGKPRCKVSGTDGNVFALMSIVRRTLIAAGKPEQAKTCCDQLFDCKSYAEALFLMAKYVEFE